METLAFNNAEKSLLEMGFKILAYRKFNKYREGYVLQRIIDKYTKTSVSIIPSKEGCVLLYSDGFFTDWGLTYKSGKFAFNRILSYSKLSEQWFEKQALKVINGFYDKKEVSDV